MIYVEYYIYERTFCSNFLVIKQVLRDRVVVTSDGPRYVAEILVRKVPDDRQCIDLRVCILGSADVGKSTLLGKYT